MNYKPEELDLLASVLDRAFDEKPLHLSRELMTSRLLWMARRGERDPDLLLKHALGNHA